VLQGKWPASSHCGPSVHGINELFGFHGFYDPAGGHFLAVFLEGDDEAVDDVAVLVVVTGGVGGDAVGDRGEAAGEQVVGALAVGVVGGEEPGREVEHFDDRLVVVGAFEQRDKEVSASRCTPEGRSPSSPGPW